MSDLSLSKRFVNETTAFWALQHNLKVAEGTPKIFYTLLGVGDNMNEIKQEFIEETIDTFEKRIQALNK